VTKHPQNGPTFSKAPAKKNQPKTVSSPAQAKAELEEKKRDAAKSRRRHKLSHTDSRAFLRELGIPIGEAPPPEPPLKIRRLRPKEQQ
jgi:hypothetical protein